MTPTAPADDRARVLVERVQSLLSDRRVRQARMFGVLAVMVDDAMAVAAHKDGSLLVRVDPAEDAELLERPGAARAEMGAGRSMGTGWIRVDAEVLDDERVLAGWVGCATRFLAGR